MNSTQWRGDRVPTATTGLLGLAGCIVSAWWIRSEGTEVEVGHATTVLLFLVAAPMLLWDGLVVEVWKRPSTGLRLPPGPPVPSRWLAKYVGLVATLATVAFCYWLFPEYHDPFYKPFWAFCKWAVPLTLVLAIPYIPWVDMCMEQPEDAYADIGRLLTGRVRRIDASRLRMHALGWGIKGYFLPLMYVYLTNNVRYIQQHPWSWPWEGFGLFYDWAYNFLFTIDLGFVVVGYSLTLRLFDAHIRRPETTTLGWLSALVCYQPFWSAMEVSYLRYGSEKPWGVWLVDHPALFVGWGLAILLVLCGFVSATVVFGLRFSNLTHRGIVCFGPYAFTRHPAYITKILSFAMIALPFLPTTPGVEGVLEAVRRTALLFLLAGIYWIRALTEERNLSHDPTYLVYSRWLRMRHRRWMRFFRRLRPQ